MKKSIPLLILYVLFAVGILGHSIGLLRPLMLLLTPWMLLLTGIMVLLPILKEGSRKFIIWFCVTLIVTFFIEVIGVKTGKIFGPYHYGDVLGAKVLEVPLIIGANWVFVVLGSVLIINKVIRWNSMAGGLARIFGAATLTTLFDFILEPVAIGLGYWNWHTVSIPLQNYFAWFVISLFAALFFRLLKVKVNTGYPSHYFLIQAVFFIFLRFLIR
jgi:bisanhydrobacterioruberin hydratase